MIIGESIESISFINLNMGDGRSEMLAFSQKMKTTACQVDTNSRLAKMRDQEKHLNQKTLMSVSKN